MRANFLSTSFNFTSRKRQKYRERKRGNKNSLSPPSQESHFLENSHGENPLISISLNREKFHHPRPFHATRSDLEEGKKKRERPRRCYIKLLQAEKPLHSNEDRWRTIGFSCLSLTSALASWHVNSNGERINLRPISSPLLCSEWRIYHSIIPGKRQSALVPSRRRRSAVAKETLAHLLSFFLRRSEMKEEER